MKTASNLLSAQYDKLHHEEMQDKIAQTWFKEANMTEEQVVKYLEISKHLHGKIDILDVNEVVQAVLNIHAQKAEKDINIQPISEIEIKPEYNHPQPENAE